MRSSRKDPATTASHAGQSQEVNTADDPVSRVLRASNHTDVFQFDETTVYDDKLLRERFKQLARLVHPDKNLHPLSHEAFIRLQSSYETLQLSLTKCGLNCHFQNDSEHNSEQNHRSDSRKRPAASTTVADEREYGRYVPRTKASPIKSFEELFPDESVIDNHSHEWKRFCLNTRRGRWTKILTGNDVQDTVDCTAASASASISSALTSTIFERGRSAEVIIEADPADDSSTVCTLCRRRFKSFEARERHVSESALHARNVEIEQSAHIV